jgi:hypothetical protein
MVSGHFPSDASIDPLPRSHRPGDKVKALARVLLATALILGASGCAKTDWIERTLVTETIAGVWAGSMVSPDGQPSVSQDVKLELQQEGPKVIGSFRMGYLGASVRGSVPIEGSVAGDVFTFKDARGTLAGDLTVNGDEMKGRGIFGNSRPVTFNLRRVDASSPAR